MLKLEKQQREINREWIPPKVVYQDAESITTAEGAKLVKDGEKLLFEDGTIYYEPKDTDLVELIQVTYV